jgi:hypothetical protein
MTKQEWDVLLKKAVNEDFAWFVGRSKELDRTFAPKVLGEIKRTHMVGFLQGLIWQRRRDAAAGRRPA